MHDKIETRALPILEVGTTPGEAQSGERLEQLTEVSGTLFGGASLVVGQPNQTDGQAPPLSELSAPDTTTNSDEDRVDHPQPDDGMPVSSGTVADSDPEEPDNPVESDADLAPLEPPADTPESEPVEPAQLTDNDNKDENQDGDPAEEGRRRREQRNTQARIAAVTAVRDNGHCIFLDGRVYDYIERLGWCEVSTEVLRSRIVDELASFMDLEPADVTPRMTSDTTQAFRDTTSQPPAATIIERDDTGRAFTLQDGMPVLGVPWIDMIVHLTAQGEIMLTRRNADVWCPRAPVPLEWGDGTWVKPERTLEFLRRATTTFDGDPDSPEAHLTAEWIMSGIGQTLIEFVDNHALWVLFGAGGRGKGTVMRLCEILAGGSFAVQGPKDLADRFALSSPVVREDAPNHRVTRSGHKRPRLGDRRVSA